MHVIVVRVLLCMYRYVHRSMVFDGRFFLDCIASRLLLNGLWCRWWRRIVLIVFVLLRRTIIGNVLSCQLLGEVFRLVQIFILDNVGKLALSLHLLLLQVFTMIACIGDVLRVLTNSQRFWIIRHLEMGASASYSLFLSHTYCCRRSSSPSLT